MKLAISNKGYADALKQIGGILNKLMISKDIEEIFNHYIDVVNSDEAAAILTLAEVLRSKEVDDSVPLPTSIEEK